MTSAGSYPDPQDPKVRSFDHFDGFISKILDLEKESKGTRNQFTSPDFEGCYKSSGANVTKSRRGPQRPGGRSGGSEAR